MTFSHVGVIGFDKEKNANSLSRSKRVLAERIVRCMQFGSTKSNGSSRGSSSSSSDNTASTGHLSIPICAAPASATTRPTTAVTTEIWSGEDKVKRECKY